MRFLGAAAGGIVAQMREMNMQMIVRWLIVQVDAQLWFGDSVLLFDSRLNGRKFQ